VAVAWSIYSHLP